MPGAGRSESAAVRTIGATVVLIAVVGYLFFGWSFDGSAGATPSVIGGIVAVSAIGWTLYRRVRSARGRAMAGLSRDETASILVIGVTVAVFAWYRNDITGVGRWTNAAIAFVVSIVFATATTGVLKRWNPVWYRS